MFDPYLIYLHSLTQSWKWTVARWMMTNSSTNRECHPLPVSGRVPYPIPPYTHSIPYRDCGRFRPTHFTSLRKSHAPVIWGPGQTGATAPVTVPAGDTGHGRAVRGWTWASGFPHLIHSQGNHRNPADPIQLGTCSRHARDQEALGKASC